MSKSKSVAVHQRKVWAYDNSHDVAVAHLAELADEFGVAQEVTERWQVWASIPDLGFQYSGADPEDGLLLEMLRRVRRRVIDHGDIGPDDLRNWYVLPDYPVATGFVRGGSLPAAAVLDFVDGLDELIQGTLADNPRGSWWFLGTPGGRKSIPMSDTAT